MLKSKVSGPGLWTILGDSLLSKNGLIRVDQITAEIVCIYFSAHWCPPCRAFTPQLSNLYSTAKAQKKSVEIVFSSGDRDESSFNEYYRSMPWLAVPFSNRRQSQLLSSMYGISGIPSFVILDKFGNLIEKEGTRLIRSQGAGFISQLPTAEAPVVQMSPADVKKVDAIFDEIQESDIPTFELCAGFKTVAKVLTNVIENPKDEKYRSLKKDNDTVQSKILFHRGFVELLKIAGFEDKPDVLAIPANKELPIGPMKTIVELCSGLAASLQAI